MSAQQLIYSVRHHFDVWGNPDDGYEVNDSRDAGLLTVDEGTSDEQLLDAMYAAGITNMSGARALANGVTVTDHGSGIEIDSPEGAPLYSLDLH